MRGCCACYQCVQKSLGRCVFDDDGTNNIIEKLKDADGIVVGSPTYMLLRKGAARANSTFLSTASSSPTSSVSSVVRFQLKLAASPAPDLSTATKTISN